VEQRLKRVSFFLSAEEGLSLAAPFVSSRVFVKSKSQFGIGDSRNPAVFSVRRRFGSQQCEVVFRLFNFGAPLVRI